MWAAAPVAKQKILKDGEESFVSRGIGKDFTPGCFVCGGEKKLYSNIAAFVASKENGELVVAMFKTGAWLDYRELEPQWIQVKVGACDEHEQNLEHLEGLTQNAGGIISAEMIGLAVARKRA